MRAIRLLHRVAMELFGTPVSKEMNDAFVADTTPTALDSLAKRLSHRPGLHAWAGPLQSGPTKFRVLPADPDAAKKPRTASNPGGYTLGENATLVVIRRPDRRAHRERSEHSFFSHRPDKPAPREPHKLKLPDGYNTWAAAWVRGGTVLWVTQKGLLRKIDFSNPKGGGNALRGRHSRRRTVPADIREALPPRSLCPMRRSSSNR